MRQSFAPPLLFLSLSNLIYPFPLSLLPSLSYFYASLFSSHFLTVFLSSTIFNPLRRSCLSFSICLRFFSCFVYFVFFRCKIQPPILTPRITIFSFREIHKIFPLALIWWSGSVSVKDTSSHALRKSHLFKFFTLIFMIKVKIIQ